MRTRAVAFGVLIAIVVAHPAAATTATSAQVRDLAQRALDDPSALAELRNIDSIDGKSVDMSRALGGATPSELRSRLATLAQDVTPGSSQASARSNARAILNERRYSQSSLPRPFAGILDRIGRGLQRLFRPLTRHIPRLGSVAWIVIGAIVVALAVLITYRLGRRRRAVETEYAKIIRTKSLRPEDLERAARDAEVAGRVVEAIRLRFAAGLIRLDRAGAIEWHPSITSGSVRRRLRSSSFDCVATSFERVIYGKRTPTPDDIELSKSGWHEVLEDVAA